MDIPIINVGQRLFLGLSARNTIPARIGDRVSNAIIMALTSVAEALCNAIVKNKIPVSP